MNNKWKIIKTLFLKEVCDVLRDKKAIMMMVFVPVIIYPLIMVVSMAIASMVDGNNDRVYDIVVYNESSRFDAENLENVLKENAVEKNEEDGSEEQLYSINYEISDKKISEEECKNKIDDKEFDAYIEITDIDEKMDVKAFYMESVNESSDAMDKVRKAVDSSDEQMAGMLMGMILPLMIILSILISVMHPSIDLTAGEKERGTLETLLMLPVSGKYIVLSKTLTAAMCGVVTAILNILSMSAVFIIFIEQSKIAGMMGGFNIEFSSFISAMLITFPVIIVTALFMSAIFMCFTCFAKASQNCL